MDLLSKTLLSLKIKNMLVATLHLGEPWGFTSNDRYYGMSFHVLDNDCWLTPEGYQPIHLHAGDSFIYPNGGLMTVSSELNTEAVAFPKMLNKPEGEFDGFDSYIPGAYGDIHWGGSGKITRLLNVMFEIEPHSRSALFDALPTFFVLRKHECPDSQILKDALSAIASEEYNERPGEYAIKYNLSSVLLHSQLRTHITLTNYSSGIIAAIKDTFLHKSLAAIHKEPEVKWTADSLAKLAGLSRTGLIERFSRILDSTPTKYIHKHRMQLAVSMLKNTESNIEQIAYELGYSSVKIFRRYFVEEFSMTPSQLRKSSYS